MPLDLHAKYDKLIENVQIIDPANKEELDNIFKGISGNAIALTDIIIHINQQNWPVSFFKHLLLDTSWKNDIPIWLGLSPVQAQTILNNISEDKQRQLFEQNPEFFLEYNDDKHSEALRKYIFHQIQHNLTIENYLSIIQDKNQMNQLAYSLTLSPKIDELKNVNFENLISAINNALQNGQLTRSTIRSITQYYPGSKLVGYVINNLFRLDEKTQNDYLFEVNHKGESLLAILAQTPLSYGKIALLESLKQKKDSATLKNYLSHQPHGNSNVLTLLVKNTPLNYIDGAYEAYLQSILNNLNDNDKNDCYEDALLDYLTQAKVADSQLARHVFLDVSHLAPNRLCQRPQTQRSHLQTVAHTNPTYCCDLIKQTPADYLQDHNNPSQQHILVVTLTHVSRNDLESLLYKHAEIFNKLTTGETRNLVTSTHQNDISFFRQYYLAFKNRVNKLTDEGQQDKIMEAFHRVTNTLLMRMKGDDQPSYVDFINNNPLTLQSILLISNTRSQAYQPIIQTIFDQLFIFQGNHLHQQFRSIFSQSIPKNDEDTTFILRPMLHDLSEQHLASIDNVYHSDKQLLYQDIDGASGVFKLASLWGKLDQMASIINGCFANNHIQALIDYGQRYELNLLSLCYHRNNSVYNQITQEHWHTLEPQQQYDLLTMPGNNIQHSWVYELLSQSHMQSLKQILPNDHSMALKAIAPWFSMHQMNRDPHQDAAIFEHLVLPHLVPVDNSAPPRIDDVDAMTQHWLKSRPSKKALQRLVDNKKTPTHLRDRDELNYYRLLADKAKPAEDSLFVNSLFSHIVNYHYRRYDSWFTVNQTKTLKCLQECEDSLVSYLYQDQHNNTNSQTGAGNAIRENNPEGVEMMTTPPSKQ